MLKKTVTYTNFNDEQVTETLYFHLSKPEIIEMEVEYDGGMRQTLIKIVESNDNKEIVAHFKRLILAAYGEKSTDGRHFEKSDAIRTKFEHSAAYAQLFWDLIENETVMAEFINGVMPELNAGDQDKPTGPPPGLAYTPPSA